MNSSSPPEDHDPSSKEHSFPCPQCRASLAFSPTNGVISCPYCGWKDSIPDAASEVAENSFEQYLKVDNTSLRPLSSEAREVSCSGCGARVTFVPPEVAGTCSFCGTAIVAEAHQANPVLSPQAVLPFRITAPQALAAVKSWISKRWFAPNALKQFALTRVLSGTYLPFWTYDSHTESFYTGERGDYYYETQTYQERNAQGATITKTRQVRRTRWHTVSGRVSRWFDDVLVPGTTSLPRQHLEALEPWDLPELVEYDEKLLAGFRAQGAQIELTQGFTLAQKVMEERIRVLVRQQIGGDEQRISSLNTHYSGITFKHILLPVYVGAYHFRNKIFQVVVNARTGEVQGSRPYSWIKIALAVIAGLLLLAATAFILSNVQPSS